MRTQTKVNHWTSYWVFLLAAIGSSVGLGNIWKFPYEMGAHGGGTFLIVYIPCVIIVGLPVMMSEIMVGRYGASNPVHAVLRIVRRERLSSMWQIIGWLSLLSGFLVFSYYSVVAGWILFYVMQSASGSFVNVPAEIVQHSFGALVRNTDQLIIWYTVFILSVVLVLTRGVRVGLERALLILMPCFIALLVWLCVYASQTGDINRALEFIFSYDLALIDAELIVSALSQALFSLSIGLGALMIYGAYLGENRGVASTATTVMAIDTLVALLMALMIFSIVFAFDLRPDAGKALIFETLPVAFSQMREYSVWYSTSFFSLLAVAALISGFALLEPAIAWMVRRFDRSRRFAAWAVGGLAWLTGLPAIFAFNEAKFSFYYFGKEYSDGLFDVLNIFTTHIFMPMIALLITIFVGWRIGRRRSQAQLALPLEIGFRLWRFCSKVLVPIIILLALLAVLFYPA